MVANPPESRLLLRTAGVVLVVSTGAKSAEDIFSVRICPLEPGDHKLSQKLVVNVGINPFASENRLSAAEIPETCSHSASIAAIRPLVVMSGPRYHLGAFSS